MESLQGSINWTVGRKRSLGNKQKLKEKKSIPSKFSKWMKKDYKGKCL